MRRAPLALRTMKMMITTRGREKSFFPLADSLADPRADSRADDGGFPRALPLTSSLALLEPSRADTLAEFIFREKKKSF